jgi:radical SAM protein with 4Fe4S-binding SPASM domain
MIHFCEKNDLSFNISSEISKRYDESTPLTQNVPLTEDQFKELLVGPHAQYFMTQGKVESYQCSCARSVCGLSVNADIYPCVGAPIKAGNLHNNSFKEIWHNSKELNKIRNLKNSDFKSCVTCDVKDDCTRSSGDIYVNTGEYTGCDPQALVKAKLRNQTKKNLSKSFLTS